MRKIRKWNAEQMLITNASVTHAYIHKHMQQTYNKNNMEKHMQTLPNNVHTKTCTINHDKLCKQHLQNKYAINKYPAGAVAHRKKHIIVVILSMSMLQLQLAVL